MSLTSNIGSTPERGAQEVAAKLTRLIACRTVSRPNRGEEDREEFTRHAQLLTELFPHVAGAVEQHVLGITGQLWHWRGTESSKPVVLMAHQDVVPVESEEDWEHPPFAGVIADGRVHGRGALDDKGDLACILQAADELAATGFIPGQDIYFFFGDCEETAGPTAMLAVDFLSAAGVRPWMVLDEGGAVAGQAFPGINTPVGVIGVSEKGLLDLELTAADAGGHASAPPRFGAVQRIARAVGRLQAKPFPASMHPVTSETFRRLGVGAPGLMGTGLKWVARRGRIAAEALALLGAEPAAMVRTTVAATRLEGSDGINMLARRAAVVLNIRIAVTESVEGVIAGIRKRVRDPQINLSVLSATEPSPISPIDSEGFALLESALGHSHPGARTVPYVMMAATDARRFTGICVQVYRFAPLGMDKAQRGSIHGTNEWVEVAELGRAVSFYTFLLRSL